MSAFLTATLAFPTVLFTGALCLVILYWGMVIVGLFDIDLLDFGGELDGLGEGLDAAADAAIEGAMEAGADAAAEGAVEPGADAAGDAADGVDNDGPQPSWLGRVFSALNLQKVPVTVTISFLVLFGWVLCFTAVDQLGPAMAALMPAFVSGVVITIASTIVSLVLTSFTVRPLAPFFETVEGPRRSAFIGQTATVTTSRVDDRFGQAEVVDGGAGLLIQVRCDHPNRLRRNAEALVVHYDDDREAFIVEPLAVEPMEERAETRIEAALSNMTPKGQPA